MAFMKIHCGYCGQAWEIYYRDDWHSRKASECPHCQSRIDRQTWENQILPAFDALCDANADLFRAHTGQHTALFTVDFIEDRYFPRREI